MRSLEALSTLTMASVAAICLVLVTTALVLLTRGTPDDDEYASEVCARARAPPLATLSVRAPVFSLCRVVR